MPRLKLKELELKGFKSINSQGQKIEFDDLTVLLGANGAGKSNLISFFKMLNSMMTASLETYVAEQNFSDSLLYMGSEVTPSMEATLLLSDEEKIDYCQFHFKLANSNGNLIFIEESASLKSEFKNPLHIRNSIINLGHGHKNSNLPSANIESAKIITGLLNTCKVFQFHNTSSNAKIRNPGYIGDADYLHSDADNLAAFLYNLKNRENGGQYYQRIVRRIRDIMPQFHDFILSPIPANKEYIKLDWQMQGKDYRFGPHQISDGTLRFMALATLLLQPKELLPSVIVLDEPELGLHPAAIATLAGMMRVAAEESQLIIATQSQRLVDEFMPEEIVITERDEPNNCTTFKRLDSEKLAEWLERYSLSELWEKNVIGGRP